MKKIIIALMLVLLAAIIGIKVYSHYCKQLLREVDRYALPKVVEFMETLSHWNFDELKPLLTEKYIDSLTAEEWQQEFDKLAVLGELKSFARPNFVSHQAYKKYKVCESAIEMYSVASEFDKDNAVVRIFFDNNCGELKITSFLVNSQSVKQIARYRDDESEGAASNPDNELVDDDTLSESMKDLEALYEAQQQDAELPELDDETKASIEKSLKEKAKKSQGKVYRY